MQKEADDDEGCFFPYERPSSVFWRGLAGSTIMKTKQQNINIQSGSNMQMIKLIAATMTIYRTQRRDGSRNRLS
nr:hypothetical protein CFP56_13302 [Quercus suber]